MGNNSPTNANHVKFIQSMNDDNFGAIDIYKNDECKYIMMLRRTFVRNGDDRCIHDFQERLDYASDNSLNQDLITPILLTQKREQNNLCIVYTIVDTYCEYFNFTLKDMILHRKDMDYDELWLCFHWLLRLAILLEEKSWVISNGLNIDKIFITLKGLPTVSIHHLMHATSQDQFFQQQRNFVEEIALSILQLACMTEIKAGDNLELYFRKCEKVDVILGQMIAAILRKSISSSKGKSCSEVLEEIERMLEAKKIVKSSQIRLNKFKYIIPKPERKIEQSRCESEKFAEKVEDKPIVINNLQGRKGKVGGSLRESQKKSILAMIEPGIVPIPFNTMTLKQGNSLACDIETRKRQSEKNWERISQRKQKIMNSVIKQNKENILGNSIRSVRPSYQKKQSWTRKIINEQMRTSKRK